MSRCFQLQTNQANLREYKIPGLAKFVMTTRSIESDNCVLNFNHDGITMKEEFPAQSTKNGDSGKSYGQNGKNGEDGAVGINGYDGTEGSTRSVYLQLSIAFKIRFLI